MSSTIALVGWSLDAGAHTSTPSTVDEVYACPTRRASSAAPTTPRRRRRSRPSSRTRGCPRPRRRSRRPRHRPSRGPRRVNPDPLSASSRSPSTFWVSCSSEPSAGNFSAIRNRFIFCEAAGSRCATTTTSAPLGTLFKTASGAPRSEEVGRRGADHAEDQRRRRRPRGRSSQRASAAHASTPGRRPASRRAAAAAPTGRLLGRALIAHGCSGSYRPATAKPRPRGSIAAQRRVRSSRRTVHAARRSGRGSTPMPGPSGTSIVPSGSSTNGSVRSSGK